MRYSKVGPVLGLALLLAQGVATACDQLAPNPNPSGSTVTNTSADGCNATGTYDNSGTVENTGKIEFRDGGLDNKGVVNNQGDIGHAGIANSGTINNRGAISNLNPGSVIVSTGTINNFGAIQNFGVVSNQGLLVNNGQIDNLHDVVANGGTIINRGNIETQGAFFNSGVMLNHSTITTRTDSGLYAQASGETIVEGSIRQMEVRVDGGVLQGNGTIDVTSPFANGKPPTNKGFVVNGGAVNAGSRGADTGTLSVRGDMTFNAGSLVTEIASAGLSDLLRVTDTASFLGGIFEFAFLDGYLPNLGDEWTFFTAGKGLSGWEALTIASSLPDNYLLAVNERGNDLVVSVAAVPEPEVYASMALGLAVLGFLSRRRKSARA